jgi:hypothetical protein
MNPIHSVDLSAVAQSTLFGNTVASMRDATVRVRLQALQAKLLGKKNIVPTEPCS